MCCSNGKVNPEPFPPLPQQLADLFEGATDQSVCFLQDIRKYNIALYIYIYIYDLLDLGPSASQSSDGGASAAFRILVDSSLHCCLFWAMHLRCSRSSLVVSCSVFSCSLDRSLLRTTGSVVKGRPRNFFPCVAK